MKYYLSNLTAILPIRQNRYNMLQIFCLNEKNFLKYIKSSSSLEKNNNYFYFINVYYIQDANNTFYLKYKYFSSLDN